MNQTVELLAAFDDTWKAEPNWESLGDLVQDITEEGAWFQHPAYSDVPQEPMHPPSGTIMWHLVHLRGGRTELANVPDAFNAIRL